MTSFFDQVYGYLKQGLFVEKQENQTSYFVCPWASALNGMLLPLCFTGDGS